MLSLAAPAIWGQECRITPLTPAQPPLKVEEGEKAAESQTFLTTLLAVSPSNVAYTFDSASRIRRLDADGRIRTVAGNGYRTEFVTPGPARGNGLPAVGQILFSRDGVLHFTATGQVFRVLENRIDPVVGSGRPGFNGEENPALEANLGSIVHAAFDFSNRLLLIDGYNRVRRLDPDGFLRTVAGSTRAAASAGLTGDGGPATSAALSSPRQVVPFTDGSFWIKDLSGRHIRLVTPDGIIRTINQAFESSVTILQWADGAPAAASSNRVYPILANGRIETGGNPFTPFTGTPRAIDSAGALYFEGSTRPEQRNPLLKLSGSTQTVLAGAPVAATVDGQAPPFGVWDPRTGALLYSAASGGKNGILEARPGQAPKFVFGGGADIGDADGKSATSLATFGIMAFTVDGEGRIIAAEANRRRILVADSGGKVTVLKNERGEQIVYAPLGSFSSMQRIAADNAGNVYWYASGGTPTGGVFTADIAVWLRATGVVSGFTVSGFYGLTRLEDGTVAVILGNGSNFRTAYRVGLLGSLSPVPGFSMLPYTSIAHLQGEPVFTAASRLFRGAPGSIRFLDLPAPPGSSYAPDFVLSSGEQAIVHMTDGGFYRIDDWSGCPWQAQPAIAAGGVVNAANFLYPDRISPRQLMTVFGGGLGPPGGRGAILDGALRATGQAAPYPALVLGNFSGTIPNATLSGTTLPVIYSDETSATYQAVATIPAGGSYLLYYSWQGLQLVYPAPVAIVAATPALFTTGEGENRLAAAENEDGSRHGAGNPAEPGSVIRLYATGLGAMTSNLATGEYCGQTPQAVTNPVTVTVGGEETEVEFAGCVPGVIAGVYQIQVRLPQEIAPGLHEVGVKVGSAEAPAEPRVHVVVRPAEAPAKRSAR
jgi:uncharacterized protein (TIGR03437 family)